MSFVLEENNLVLISQFNFFDWLWYVLYINSLIFIGSISSIGVIQLWVCKSQQVLISKNQQFHLPRMVFHRNLSITIKSQFQKYILFRNAIGLKPQLQIQLPNKSHIFKRKHFYTQLTRINSRTN